MTPEGKVKQKIKDVLKKYPGAVYWYMPVPSGYGARTVDFIGCAWGWFFAIEAKAPKGSATALQEATLDQIREAWGVTFLIRDEVGIQELDEWLESLSWKV